MDDKTAIDTVPVEPEQPTTITKPTEPLPDLSILIEPSTASEPKTVDPTTTTTTTDPKSAKPANPTGDRPFIEVDRPIVGDRVRPVIAIDLGTASSGYAIGRSFDLYCDFSKTSTSLLLRQSDVSVIAFGDDAESTYASKTADEQADLLLFRRFKSAINKTPNCYIRPVSCRCLPTNDCSCGRKLHSLLLFSIVLRCLKDQALASGLIGVTIVDAGQADWILTVPDDWSDETKQFIRTAATNAGIASPCLSFVRESEAAAVYCLSRLKTAEQLEPTTSFLVVDIGAASVRYSIHRTATDYVRTDDCTFDASAAFVRFTDRLFGAASMADYRQTDSVGWSTFLRRFESARQNVNPAVDKFFNLPMPVDLIRKLQSVGKLPKASAAPFALRWPATDDKPNEKSADEESGATFSNFMLRIPTKRMVELFADVVNAVVDGLITIVQKHPISTVFTVGGLSENIVIRQAVDAALKSTIRHVHPDGAAVANRRGAVLAGMSPKVVRTKVARFTYGIGVSEKYDPTVHKNRPVQSRIQADRRVDYVTGVFRPIVRRGDIVTDDAVVFDGLRTGDDLQTIITIDLYRTAIDIVGKIAVDDPAVERVGSLALPLVGGGLRRPVRLNLFCGRPVFEASAVDGNGGTSVSGRFGSAVDS